MSTDPLDSTPLLLQALQNPSVYDHPVQQFRVLETHISWVLLTGSYVYKIKKPVNLGFVDFSTLDRRRFFCGEELRLNQRLAPDLYKDLVAITGTQQSPELNGTGPVIEYAVKMKEFPQDALLSRVLERGDLHSSHISALAKQIADFHNRIEVAGADTSFGEPDSLNRPVMENFQHLPSQVYHLVAKERIDHLRHWAEQEHASRRVDFRERKNNGYIRECHGDLHLGNMALIDNAITIFD
jgi:hypothetical protein